MKKLIEGNAVAVATISNNDVPHCIAVGYVKVVSPNQILLTNNYMRQTPENIKRAASVACAVWGREWEKVCEGYELIGRAEYFADGPWLEKIQAIPENQGEPCLGAILITIEKVKRLA